MTTCGGAIPSCNLGDLSKDTNPSRALGNALVLKGPEITGGGGQGRTGWKVSDKWNHFPLAGCAPAPAHPKGLFLNKYFNHLPQTPKRSVCFLHTCFKLI